MACHSLPDGFNLVIDRLLGYAATLVHISHQHLLRVSYLHVSHQHLLRGQKQCRNHKCIAKKADVTSYVFGEKQC